MGTDSAAAKKPGMKDYLFLHLIFLQLSTGYFYSVRAAQAEWFSFRFFLFYGLMLMNLVIYSILWQQALKRFPLTVAFANKAVSLVWSVLWGMLFFGDTLSVRGILGVLLTVFGIVLVVTDHE